MTSQTAKAGARPRALGVNSPALTAGLILMPVLIAAGLLRERLDAAAPVAPDVVLRPSLSAAPAPETPTRLALRAP